MNEADLPILRGKVVVLTGGAVGIGRIYAEGIARAGAALVVTDLDGDAAEAAAADLRRSGADAIGVGANICNPAEVEKVAIAAAAHFSAVDGLVNNAALMSALPRRQWLEIPIEEWDRVMAVNLKGPFLMCRAVHALMRERGGSIVNIASTRALDGTPNRLHYTASKGGVIAFTKALAREVGEDRIRVNALAPGLTLSESQIATSDQDYLRKIAAGRALPGQQHPRDLVGAVLFLLSDASRFMSGQTIVVDGGRVMR